MYFGSRNSKQLSNLISRVEMSGKNDGNKQMHVKQSWCTQKFKKPIRVHKKEQAPLEIGKMTGSDKGQLPPSKWVEPGSRPHRSLISIDAARPPASSPATKPPLCTGKGALKKDHD
jgi:hypothetical protein